MRGGIFRREVRCARIARAFIKAISVVFAPRRAYSGFRPSVTWQKCYIYPYSACALAHRGSGVCFRPFPCHPPYTNEVGGVIR